jgi:hypothetical protein
MALASCLHHHSWVVVGALPPLRRGGDNTLGVAFVSVLVARGPNNGLSRRHVLGCVRLLVVYFVPCCSWNGCDESDERRKKSRDLLESSDIVHNIPDAAFVVAAVVVAVVVGSTLRHDVDRLDRGDDEWETIWGTKTGEDIHCRNHGREDRDGLMGDIVVDRSELRTAPVDTVDGVHSQDKPGMDRVAAGRRRTLKDDDVHRRLGDSDMLLVVARNIFQHHYYHDEMTSLSQHLMRQQPQCFGVDATSCYIPRNPL